MIPLGKALYFDCSNVLSVMTVAFLLAYVVTGAIFLLVSDPYLEKIETSPISNFTKPLINITKPVVSQLERLKTVLTASWAVAAALLVLCCQKLIITKKEYQDLSGSLIQNIFIIHNKVLKHMKLNKNLPKLHSNSKKTGKIEKLREQIAKKFPDMKEDEKLFLLVDKGELELADDSDVEILQNGQTIKIAAQKDESSWAVEWATKTFPGDTLSDLANAIGKKYPKPSERELNDLLGVLQSYEGLSLVSSDNLTKLISNGVLTTDQFKSLFDELNKPERKLGTIDNFLFLFSKGVKTAELFQKLTKKNYSRLGKGIPFDLSLYFENLRDS